MDPITLAVLVLVVLVLVPVIVIWQKGRSFAQGDVFRASRLSAGNRLFPTQVLITPQSVVHFTPQWIGRLELLNWGEKTLVRLFEEGLAREPADLYRITPEQLMALDGFGETTAKKLLEPLHALKKIPLDRFIAALGIESVSLETGALLVRAGYDSMPKIAEATLEELSGIAGLGAIKAEKIKEGVGGRLAEVERLAAVGVVPVAPREGGPLAGLTFCFSGSHARPRKVLEGIVDRHGGRVASGVTKGVDYLVLADASSTSSKAEKARKLGTAVIDEATFDEVVRARGGTVE